MKCVAISNPSSISALLILILFCIATLFPSKVQAVDCSSSDISLHSQDEIDNFQATYGGGGVCDTITSDLTIIISSATNVDGLSALKYIGNDLKIRSTSLNNLDGLSNLMSVGNDLEIENNDLLTNINGLNSLTNLGRSLIIIFNPSLANINGISGLISNNGGVVNGGIVIENNDALTSIEALSALQSIGGDLRIHSNDVLPNLDSLTNLSTISGALGLYNNDILTNLNGLRNLTKVGWLSIEYNDTLTNVNGLSSLISVDNDVRITSNPLLQQCAGLIPLFDDIDDGIPGPGPGVAGIPDVKLDVYLSGNPPGCNTPQLILESESSGDLKVSKSYSDGNPGPVTISLDCESPTTLVETINSDASTSIDAEFKLRRFIPGFNAKCSATETNVPSGYSADESNCMNLEMTNGGSLNCEIINNQNSVTVLVTKEYVNSQPSVDPEVTITLTCPTGQILPGGSVSTSGGVAAFEVLDFPFDGETCVATELVPHGYIQVEAIGCATLLVSPGVNPAPSCTIRNDLDPEIIFFSGFEE